MNEQYVASVKDYFKKKASQYDLVEDQIYWVLSDKLLWKCLSAHLDTLCKDFHFLDAGGGTGRWSKKIIDQYPLCSGTTFDLSEDMLVECRSKVGVDENRWEVIQGNLEDYENDPLKDKYDVIFSFHNVLGFVSNPRKVINNLASKLKPGGLLITFLPSMYHLIFFNIFIDNVNESLNAMKNMKGKFTSDMPDMALFTPDVIRKMYWEAGLSQIKTSGFPNFIYPGMQETQLIGSSSQLVNILDKKDNFETILAIEEEFMFEESISARANNLFTVGMK